MDRESIVYGCIKDIACSGDDEQRRICNRAAMLHLPKAEDWSWLCQEMFSIPRIQRGEDRYLTEVIHFGASYRGIEYEWGNWMESFEALLERMYWISAVVHLETELAGIHTFNWESPGDYHSPGHGIRSIRCEWVHEQNFL